MIHCILISALRSLIMAGIVWSGMKLLRVSHVLAQKIAWTFVLFLSFALALPTRYLPLGQAGEVALPVYRFLPPISPLPSAPPADLAHTFMPAQNTAAAADLAPISNLPNTPVSTRAALTPLLLKPGISIYLFVFAVLLGRLLVGLMMALRIWLRTTPITAEALSCPNLGNSLRLSPDLSAPVTIGSSILLPESYREWSTDKLRIVLAHERSHIRQGDFYLQILARLYTTIFWISPLGWWLQRKLSDLGEAVSDRAALAQAENRSSYAELLLEFAATPRLPLFGVGMARASNLHERIDRLLSDAQFRLAFLRTRRHIVVAAALVVIAIAAATTRVRVEAKEVALADLALLPIPPVEAGVPAPPDHAAAPLPQQKATQDAPKDAYAIVDGASNTTMATGPLGDDFERIHRSHSGSYIWFRRDGKSYIIDDPALVGQGQALFRPSSDLGIAASRLADMHRSLAEQELRMDNLHLNVVIPKIDMAPIVAKTQESLKNLDRDSAPLSQQELNHIQAKIAADLAEAQSKINANSAMISERVAQEMAQAQARLAQKQAQLSAKQACISGIASSRLHCLADEALRDGKARPVQ